MQPIFVLRWSEGASSWIYKAEIRRDKELFVNNEAKAKRASTKTYPGRRETKCQHSWHQHDVFYYFSTTLNVMVVFVILRHTRWKSCSYNAFFQEFGKTCNMQSLYHHSLTCSSVKARADSLCILGMWTVDVLARQHVERIVRETAVFEFSYASNRILSRHRTGFAQKALCCFNISLTSYAHGLQKVCSSLPDLLLWCKKNCCHRFSPNGPGLIPR